MAAHQNGDGPQGPQGDADLAQAFKDLARGEQTASTLENHLDALEAKIEELLAVADAQQDAGHQGAANQTQSANQDSAGSSAGKES